MLRADAETEEVIDIVQKLFSELRYSIFDDPICSGREGFEYGAGGGETEGENGVKDSLTVVNETEQMIIGRSDGDAAISTLDVDFEEEHVRQACFVVIDDADSVVESGEVAFERSDVSVDAVGSGSCARADERTGPAEVVNEPELG